jgi:hypothetical protein
MSEYEIAKDITALQQQVNQLTLVVNELAIRAKQEDEAVLAQQQGTHGSN